MTMEEKIAQAMQNPDFASIVRIMTLADDEKLGIIYHFVLALLSGRARDGG